MQKLNIKQGSKLNSNLNINKNMKIKFPTISVEEMFPNPFDNQKSSVQLKLQKNPNINSNLQKYKDNLFDMNSFEKKLKDIDVDVLKE